ncbi:MAG TPA: hypothetical protein VFC44_12335 [Candidatus Saccharimonadales bacterium]|nr:hypothetical protein [Candidatus Saccharimonadales bacterium]
MTEQEAKSINIKNTAYCYVLKCAWDGEEFNSICLERIFTKKRGVEEIRLAWWKDRRQTMRPADVDAIDWVRLFENAVKKGVFTDAEKLGMLKALK